MSTPHTARSMPAVLAGLALAVPALTGCTGQAAAPTPVPTVTARAQPAPRSPIAAPTPTPVWDRVGTTAAPGYPPLVIPAGLPHGYDATVPAAVTGGNTDTVYLPGVPFIAYLPNPSGLPHADMTVIGAVDRISKPATSPATLARLAKVDGVGTTQGIAYQAVTMRIREVAGSRGAAAVWSLPAVVNPANELGNMMPVQAGDTVGDPSCKGSATPLKGHGLSSGDQTVQVCFWVGGNAALGKGQWLNEVQLLAVNPQTGRPDPFQLSSDLTPPLPPQGE